MYTPYGEVFSGGFIALVPLKAVAHVKFSNRLPEIEFKDTRARFFAPMYTVLVAILAGGIYIVAFLL